MGGLPDGATFRPDNRRLWLIGVDQEAQTILASEKGEDLAPVVQAITHGFGFDVFAHGVMLSLRLEAESQIYLFSTHTPAWVQIYD
jgi:hypothetical protein